MQITNFKVRKATAHLILNLTAARHTIATKLYENWKLLEGGNCVSRTSAYFLIRSLNTMLQS